MLTVDTEMLKCIADECQQTESRHKTMGRFGGGVTGDRGNTASGANGSSKRSASYMPAAGSGTKTTSAGATSGSCGGGSSSKSNNKKWIRLATVFAYVVAVSLAAVALAIYYSLMWNPSVFDQQQSGSTTTTSATSTTSGAASSGTAGATMAPASSISSSANGTNATNGS